MWSLVLVGGCLYVMAACARIMSGVCVSDKFTARVHGEGLGVRLYEWVCAWRKGPVTWKGLDVSRRVDRCSAEGQKLSVCDPQVMFKPTFSFQQWGGRRRCHCASPSRPPPPSVKLCRLPPHQLPTNQLYLLSSLCHFLLLQQTW